MHALNRFSKLTLPSTVLFLACGNHAGSERTELSVEQLMDPKTCAECHSKQYAEWSGSMHDYASADPLFVALNKRGQDEAQLGTFCAGCHALLAVRTGATHDGANLSSLPERLQG